MAGINAALKAGGIDKPFVLDRADAYIGVLIDDLITLGATEPYRMFTARAEYRLSLRADNADIRLTQKGIDIGCVKEKRAKIFTDKTKIIKDALAALESMSFVCNEWVNVGVPCGISVRRKTAADVLCIPSFSFPTLLTKLRELNASSIYPQQMSILESVTEKVADYLSIEMKYSKYLSRQQREINELRIHENMVIPKDFNYYSFNVFSNEEKEKLTRLKPDTIGAANRISGITPSSLIFLYGHFKKLEEAKKQWKRPAQL